MVKTWAGKKWGIQFGQNVGGKKVGDSIWSKRGRGKSGGWNGVNKGEGKKWGMELGHNKGRKKIGDGTRSVRGREEEEGVRVEQA